MRILLATRSLAEPAGSETYAETVALELRQLGHEVELSAPYHGVVADRLRTAGLDVRDSLDALGHAPDVVHVQQASTALRVRARLPAVPMVYVCHSSVLDIEDPPDFASPQLVVALNDFVAERVRVSAVGASTPQVRLRQPVRAPHSEPGLVPIADRPRRALLAGHRSDLVERDARAACAALGIELECLGQDGHGVDDLTPAIMRSDIVFAAGRTLLEAMALARAGFLLENRGSGGFVTAESYPAFEAGAFVRVDAAPVTVAGLRDELSRYDPALGRVGFELARAHHSSRSHARELVTCYRRAMEAEPPAPTDAAALLDAAADALERAFASSVAERRYRWRAAELEREVHRIYRKPVMRWARALRERRRGGRGSPQ